MTALARRENVRPDSIAPNAVHPAHLEQQILFRFVDLRTSNSEMLFDLDLLLHFDVESPFEQYFSSGSAECFGKVGHARPEMPKPGNNSAFQDYHSRACWNRSAKFTES